MHLQIALSEDATEALTEVAGRLDIRAGVGTIVRDALVDYVEDVYTTGNRGQWATLDPVTARAKGSRRILVDTGELLKNVTNPKITSTAVVASAGSAFYAQFLEAGSRGTPKRDPLPDPPHGFVADLSEQLSAYIIDGARP